MKTLIVKPVGTKFQAYLNDKPIGKPTRQPLVDGARTLLAQGMPPETLITMRHAGSKHDSFTPATVGTWGGITYKEGKSSPERRQYRPTNNGPTGRQRNPL